MLDSQHMFLSKSISQLPSLRTLLTLLRAVYNQAKPEVFTACTVAQPQPPKSGDLAGLRREGAQQVLDEIKEVWKTCGERFDPDQALLKRGLEKLEVRRRYIPANFSDSYYWAPFIFIGYDTHENEGESDVKRNVRR